MTKRTSGHTKPGTPITDDGIEQLADEAERGCGVDEIIARRGKRADRAWPPGLRRSSRFVSIQS